MYNPCSDVNAEEYLLGKKIGKNFDGHGTMGKINDVEYDVAPPSIFSSNAAHQVDLQRKLLEDPLVSIKKKEMEDRKRLMDNPVKMKALQEHIKELKEKKKKRKKKKRKDSDSDDSDVDLDLKLLQKIQSMEGHFKASSDGGETRERPREKPSTESGRQIRHKSRSSSPPRRRRRKSSSGSPARRRDRSLGGSPPRRRRSPSRNRRHESPKPPRRQRPRSPSYSPPRRRRSRSRQRMSDNIRSKEYISEPEPEHERREQAGGPKKGLSDAEKQTKLAEMMGNAAWREEQRGRRVEKHRQAVKAEEEEASKEHDQNFMRRELARAQDSLTVEGRITANKHNIQRGVGVMDKNFARR